MVFIIAEIGTNHTGSIEIAKKIIDLAVSEDCDAVKFQKKSVEEIYTKDFLNSYCESPWGTRFRCSVQWNLVRCVPVQSE